MSRIHRPEIAKTLTTVRNYIRNGTVSGNTSSKLAKLLASNFGIDYSMDFGSPTFWNGPTLDRWVKLFDFPGKVTQDDVAWALQNFINRRQDPWAWKRAVALPPGDYIVKTDGTRNVPTAMQGQQVSRSDYPELYEALQKAEAVAQPETVQPARRPSPFAR